MEPASAVAAVAAVTAAAAALAAAGSSTQLLLVPLCSEHGLLSKFKLTAARNRHSWWAGLSRCHLLCWPKQPPQRCDAQQQSSSCSSCSGLRATQLDQVCAHHSGLAIGSRLGAAQRARRYLLTVVPCAVCCAVCVQEEGKILVRRAEETKRAAAMHGLSRCAQPSAFAQSWGWIGSGSSSHDQQE